MTLIMAVALTAGCGGPDKSAEKTIVLSDAGWDSVKFLTKMMLPEVIL
jgi:ABC-type proline/glycine betaine transport system substrate-binding protein